MWDTNPQEALTPSTVEAAQSSAPTPPKPLHEGSIRRDAPATTYGRNQFTDYGGSNPESRHVAGTSPTTQLESNNDTVQGPDQDEALAPDDTPAFYGGSDARRISHTVDLAKSDASATQDDSEATCKRTDNTAAETNPAVRTNFRGAPLQDATLPSVTTLPRGLSPTTNPQGQLQTAHEDTPVLFPADATTSWTRGLTPASILRHRRPSRAPPPAPGRKAGSQSGPPGDNAPPSAIPTSADGDTPILSQVTNGEPVHGTRTLLASSRTTRQLGISPSVR